ASTAWVPSAFPSPSQASEILFSSPIGETRRAHSCPAVACSAGRKDLLRASAQTSTTCKRSLARWDTGALFGPVETCCAGDGVIKGRPGCFSQSSSRGRPRFLASGGGVRLTEGVRATHEWPRVCAVAFDE